LPFKTVLTLHHVADQGSFWGLDFALTNLPARFFTLRGLEFFGRLNFLKSGILFADRITTVSEHYRREILTPSGGCGMDGVLRENAHRLTAILDGADYTRWNPASDPLIPARYDARRLKDGQDSGQLLGKGHLAMTIDQGADMSRYQGLVALDGGSLEDAAHEYFLRSEQIPTRVRLAVGEEWRGGGGGKHRWRAGGMLLQFLPKAPERARQADLHPGDAPDGAVTHSVAEDDAWVEGQSLIGTVEDVELIDPDLSGERLLYRLFHERGVRVFTPLPLRAQCSCSREAVSAMLNSFAPPDRAEMVKDGKVEVTCEFCSSLYQFTPQEAGVE